MNKQIVSLLAALLIGATSASATTNPLDVTSGKSLGDAMDAPHGTDIYFDYRWIKPFPTGPSFVEDLKAGMWGAKITLREGPRVKELRSLLDHSPIVAHFGSDNERNEFRRGAQVIIAMGPESSDWYYVSGCKFVHEEEMGVHRVSVGLQKYLFLSEASSKCE